MKEILISLPSLQNIYFLGADTAQVLISFGGDCGHCHKFNYFQKIDVYANNLIYCLNCGRPNAMPPLLEIRPRPEVVRANLDFCLQTYGCIAFWGLGRMFRALIDPALVQGPGIVLVDAEATGRIGNKEVRRPETVLEHNPGLIVTVPDFSPAGRDIRREAARYGLTNITDLYDLMMPRINLKGRQRQILVGNS